MDWKDFTMSEKSQKESNTIFPLSTVTSYSSNTKGGNDEPTYTLDEVVNAAGFGIFQHKLLFITGLGWASDAIEVYILSVLGPMLACDWALYKWQLPLLTAGVFIGMMIGSSLFGKIADVYGRRMSIGTSLIIALISGLLSASSPSFYWMLAFRTLTGFGLAGMPQGLTLCCEYVPTKIRGRIGFFLCYYWSIGTFTVVLLSWLIMEYTNNWRILLSVAAIPAFVAALSIKWLTESARYYMVSGKPEMAEQVVKNMAETNRISLPPGRLQIIGECENRGSLGQLFSPEYIRSTILFCYLTFGTSFAYYGVCFVSPYIIENKSVKSIALLVSDNSSVNDYSGIMPCTVFNRQNYIDLLWTSAAELPGIFLFTILIERCRRKHFLCITCLISATFMFLLLIETDTKIIILLFLFGARGLIVAIFQMIYVIISESYPTTLRAIALGLGATFTKIAGIINSFISQMLILSQPIVAICILGGLVVLAAVAALCLPLETRGLELKESHASKQNKSSS